MLRAVTSGERVGGSFADDESMRLLLRARYALH